MNVLYNIGIYLFYALAHLAAPFNSKARLWIVGQNDWDIKIKEKIKLDDRTMWIHCASLGEFEQGRPVIEAIKKDIPGLKIVLTFFSSSGYEIRKNYANADCISYLPVDSPRNAERFINLIRPEFVIFVKYEFWNNYISELYDRRVPIYLVSGIFRPEQHFFKWYGSFFRSILKKFEKLYVQDDASLGLLSGIGIYNAVTAGDTRFDRVIQLTESAREIPQLERFRNGEKLFLAGSSWKPDEEIIAQYINTFPEKMKWVFAPHEIDMSNIERLENLFKVKTVRFSELNDTSSDSRVLIIDNIGMLSSAYKYAHISAIGGGFGKGIHNILEPACWSVPVVFGPNHKKFREAVELINEKGALTFDSYSKFSDILDNLLSDEQFYLKSANAAGEYVRKNIGATALIIKEILPKDINKLYS